MDPLEFMAAVLPPPGNGRYCVAELTKKKEHVYADTLEGAFKAVERWNNSKFDIYFALSTFGGADNRQAANAQMTKCIAIDIDCNHPKDVPDEHGEFKPKAYPSARIAARAILDFCTEIGLDSLGEPWLVASGGGVHGYLPLKEAVTIEEWKPVAEAFKRLCVQKKLGIDPTVTGDASRVLRVPATVNTGVKSGKRVRGATNVRFMHEGSVFDLDDIRAILEKHLAGTAYEVKAATKPSMSLVLPGQRPKQSVSDVAVKLFPNSITKFGNIYKATKAGRGCDQLKFYVDNASDDGMEPLWRGMLSIAQKCEDGERAAKWLSDRHPYDENRMHSKLAEIRGPYPCTKFDSENPGVCVKCKHWGKITNPLALGRDTAVVTAETEVKVVVAKEVRNVLRPEAPMGYAYGKNGGVYLEKQLEDEDGTITKKLTMLLSFDLFPVDILDSAGEHIVHMLALRPEGAQTITIPQKCVVSRDDTMKHLANHNILAAFGSNNDKNFFDYIRASVEKMSTEKTPKKVPASYGWQPDDTFVFAGRIYSKGDPVTIPMVGLENIVVNTQPTGDINHWREFINLLIRHKLYDHLAVILCGAGAPLMRFTGIYGLSVHCGSTDSGTGKSLALEGAASVWGHPVHYRTGKSTSPVAMQQRLGMLNSLPLVTDEITAKNRQHPEWFSDFLLDMTEGRGKERMEAGSNKERINMSTWMTMAIMSSNTYVVDSLTGNRKHASEGELRRVLEFPMNDVLSWEPHEIEIIKALHQNYAVAGEMLADYMAKNVDKMHTLVQEVVRNTYTDFNATNDERFWMAGIACAIASGLVMSDNNAGVVNVPLPEIIDAFKRRVEDMRVVLRGSKRVAEDVLNSFTGEHWGHFVVVNYGKAGGILSQMGDGAVIDRSTTRTQVMGRVENGATIGYIDFYLEERVLKTFCSSMSFGYADFKKQLEANNRFMVSYIHRKDLLAKTGGPQMRVSVMRITRRIDEDDAASQVSLGNT